MKKLNLELVGVKDMLTREQMKKVVGGYDGGGGCTDECTSDSDCKGADLCHTVGCPSGTSYKICY